MAIAVDVGKTQVTDKITIDIGWYVGVDPRQRLNFNVDSVLFADDRVTKALRILREEGIEFEVTFRQIEVPEMFVSVGTDRFFITSLTASDADICVYRLADGPIMSKEDLSLAG